MTHASITRSSQPLVGPSRKRSKEDETYVQVRVEGRGGREGRGGEGREGREGGEDETYVQVRWGEEGGGGGEDETSVSSSRCFIALSLAPS